MSGFVREVLPSNNMLKTTSGDVCGYIDSATVSVINDGDTIIILSNNVYTNGKTIRFIGINCPEYVSSIKQYEEYAASNNEEHQYKVEGIKEYAAYNNCSIEYAIEAGQKATNFTRQCIKPGDKIYIVFSVKKYSGDYPTEYESDVYGRLLGEIFFKDSSGYYVNLNKTLLLNGYAEATSFDNTYIETSGWTSYLPVSTADFRIMDNESTKKKQEIISPGLYGQYYDNSIDLEYIQVDRPIQDMNIPGYTRIGDVELVIPPLALSVIQQTKSTSVKTLRSNGSIQKTSGYIDKIIKLELFFSSTNSINGYKVKDNYGNIYYINGLRPLIAQFKKAPFVPIINEHINFNHYVDAVAIKSINARTVDGFPSCIAVTLTLIAFDTSPYMCFTDCLEGAIHWPLFRWYYQRPMQDVNSIHYISEVPKSGIRNDIYFGIPNEEVLQNLKTRLKLLNEITYYTDYSDSNSLYGQMNYDYETLTKYKEEKIKQNLWRTDDDTAAMYQKELRIKSTSTRFIAKEYEGINGKTYLTPNNKYIHITPSNKDADMIDAMIQSCAATFDGRENIEKTKEKRAKNLAFSEEDIVMDYFTIQNLIPTKINVGMENVFSSAQIQNMESSALQYLGSQDTYVSISFVGDHLAITQLSGYIKTCARYAREYRIGITTGFMSIENDFINLFGTKEAIVESCVVNNIENTNLFTVDMVLIAFNKRQKRSEKISSFNTMSGNSNIKDISDLVAMYQIYDAVPETKMLTMELYPDLELPTYNELFEFCNSTGIVYPMNNYFQQIYEHKLNVIKTIKPKTLEEANEASGGRGYGSEKERSYEEQLEGLKESLKWTYKWQVLERYFIMKDIERLEGLIAKGVENPDEIKFTPVYTIIDENTTQYLPVYVDPDFYICTPTTFRNEFKESIERITSDKTHKIYFSSVCDLNAAVSSFPNPDDDNKSIEEYDMLDEVGAGEISYATDITNKYRELLGQEAMQELQESNAESIEEESIEELAEEVLVDENADRATASNADIWQTMRSTEQKTESDADIRQVMRDPTQQISPKTTSSTTSTAKTTSNNSFASGATYIPKDFGQNKVTPQELKSQSSGKTVLYERPGIEEWAKWKNMSVDKVRDSYEQECGINPQYQSILNAIIYNEKATNFAANVTESELKIDKWLFITYIKALVYQESAWSQFIKVGNEMKPLLGGSLDTGLGQLVPSSNGFDENLARRAAWDWRFNLYATCYHYGQNVETARKEYIKANPNWATFGNRDDHKKNIMMWACAIYNMGEYNSSKGINASFKGNEWSSFNPSYTSGIMSQLSKSFCTNLNQVPDGKIVNIDGAIGFDIDGIPGSIGAPKYDSRWSDGYPPNNPEFKPYENLTGTMHDIISFDQRGRLVRAFPTFCMLLIDEGIWITWIKLWDNFYGLSGVNSIDVIKSRKNPADTCVINLSNVYGMLTNFQKYENTDSGYTRKFDISQLLFNELDTEAIVQSRKKDLDSLMLKTGARLHLRLGYGSCANNLPIVFNGTITEIGNSEDVIEIVAQGDGIELTNPIPCEPGDINDGSSMEKEPRNTLLHFMSGDEGWWQRLLDNIIYPEEEEEPGFWAKRIPKPESPYGIVHFGRPFDRFGQYVGGIGDDELGEIVLGELGINIYSTNGKGTHSQVIYDDYCNDRLSGNIDEVIMKRNNFWELDEPNLVVSLFGNSVWDLAQLFSLTAADYVTAVVPFGFRSTLFFGKPYWNLFYDEDIYYEYNANKHTYSKITSRYLFKPFSQHHVFFSETDIISNGIKASEEGIYTNVKIDFSDKDGKSKTTHVIHVDTDIYPEKQKTAIQRLDIIDKSWLLGKKRETSAMNMAYTAGAQILRDYMKDMYKGSLIILGDPTVKPLDTFTISDTAYSMSGMAGVKQVVHHFSHETGFVTNVSPDAMVFVDDKFYLDNCMKIRNAVSIGIYGLLGRMLSVKVFRDKLYPLFMITSDKTGTAWLKVAEAYNSLTGENKTFDELIELSKDSIKKLEVDLKDKKAVKVSEKVINDLIKGLETTKDDKFLKRAAKWAGRTTYKVPKGIATAAGALATGLAGSAVVALLPEIIITATLSLLTDSMFDAYSRYKKNRQAVIIMPLKSYGHDLVAGIKGHQGCVVGDSPSKIDKFYEGKNGGFSGVVIKALNFLSGNDQSYSYEVDN